ncbi:MAG TPA: sigma-54 dependent transcriptional regulator [Nitrospiraceae bacterium]
MKKRILLVDDEAGIRASLKVVLEPVYETLTASTGQEGLDLFRRESPHLVLLDVVMPGLDGLAVLKMFREENAHIPVIMLTGTKTVKTAVEAMKLGAADYLTKPFDVEELRLVVAKALETGDLEQEVLHLRAQVAKRYSFHNLIGKSSVMQEIYSKIEQLADTKATVLITGESGTGKELVARALHYNSARRERPFIAINSAALPETLIESELFGHEKGSFTDAQSRRIGQFELAHGGTLFLDEIGDLSPATQSKLLRVLQEREFTRVGGAQPIKVDVRIITATNKHLEELVKREAFREDLYYRINVVVLHLPPLRDRREDIALIAQHILAKRTEGGGRTQQEFTKNALELLTAYSWPGNVRELENVIEQSLIWSHGKPIEQEHLPTTLVQAASRSESAGIDLSSGQVSLEKSVLEFERKMILDALQRTGYVQTHAAALLGISRRMLKYRMDMLGISRPATEAGPETPQPASLTQ